MESKKINQLATELTPALDDLTIIGDPTTGISKKITLSQMASLFTGTVEEYANLAAFPLVGVADTIYIALDTNVLYRWNTGTTSYVELSPNIINSLVFNDANGFDGTISLVGSVATLTITTALTTGSVGFIGASGALLQDNANFFWDDTNNRLGLGTNAPTTAIDAFGSGIIGRLNGTSTNNAFLGFASAGSNKWSIGNVQSDHRFRIYNEAATSELVSILSTGEFGIGIANPTTKFHIDGGASALIANLDANVSVAKSLSFRSDNSNRINLEVSGTESGSNAGANFFLRTYTDLGALIETPFQIIRSTGVTTIKSLTLTNALSVANGGTGVTSLSNISSGDTNVLTISGGANSVIGGNVIFNLIYATATNGGIVSGVAQSFGGNKTFTGSVDTTELKLNNISTLIHVSSYNVIRDTDQNNAIILGNSTTPQNFYNNTDHIFRNRVGSSEYMRITSGGNVGIGTSSPTYPLHIYKTTNARLAIEGTTNFSATQYLNSGGSFYMGIDDSAGANFTGTAYGRFLYSSNAYPMSFFTDGTERIRITSGGNVLTGTTTDSYGSRLTSLLNDNGYSITAIKQATFGAAILARVDNTNSDYVRFFYSASNTQTGSINTNGTTTTYNTTSDYRLKQDLKDYKGLELISTIKTYDYEWKSDKSRMYGVVAHELQEIIPYAVQGQKDEIDENGKEKMQSVDYSKIVPILVKAIQELKTEIDELKNK